MLYSVSTCTEYGESQLYSMSDIISSFTYSNEYGSLRFSHVAGISYVGCV